jgi:hypothetical protein
LSSPQETAVALASKAVAERQMMRHDHLQYGQQLDRANIVVELNSVE